MGSRELRTGAPVLDRVRSNDPGHTGDCAPARPLDRVRSNDPGYARRLQDPSSTPDRRAGALMLRRTRVKRRKDLAGATRTRHLRPTGALRVHAAQGAGKTSAVHGCGFCSRRTRAAHAG